MLITIHEAAELLAVLLRDTTQRICIHGRPGLGKSAVVKQAAKALDIPCMSLFAVLLDAVDLRGIPSIDSGVTVWNIPKILPTDGRGVLFLDELNRAPALVQNALMELALTGTLGDYVLPDGWRVVAACNPDGVGVTKLSDAMMDRWLHLSVQANVETFQAWGRDNSINPNVVNFFDWKPERLYKHEKGDIDITATITPSPRSWERVSGILPAISGLSDTLWYAAVAGLVGPAAAGDFRTYMKALDTLTPSGEIFNDPDMARVPDEISAQHATVAALITKTTPLNVGATLVYLARCRREIEIAAITKLARDAHIAAAPEMTERHLAHHGVLHG